MQGEWNCNSVSLYLSYSNDNELCIMGYGKTSDNYVKFDACFALYKVIK